MYYDRLYEKILIEPLLSADLDKLVIISGYATAAMSFQYLNKIKEDGVNIKINLIVGMVPKDGISESNHYGFIHLANDEFSDNFHCDYVKSNPPVHSKIYIWYKDDKPKLAFSGSANYTQTALCLGKQREVMCKCNALISDRYYKRIIKDTIPCNSTNVDKYLSVYSYSLHTKIKRIEEDDKRTKEVQDYSNLQSVSTSFLDNKGELPKRSGINWGQRPEQKREPNQTYIRLTSEIYRGEFFPPSSVYFTVLTDDGKTFIGTRAQQNGKAIHTPHDNSFLGIYIRNRIGVKLGQPVTKNQLLKYGRTDVTFYKIDDETYYMDFSSK